MQRIEEGSALLMQRGEIAAQTSEGLRACVGAETARDLLLGLEQAQIPLGLIVVEGNRQVVQEGEDLSLPEPQALQQIARW